MTPTVLNRDNASGRPRPPGGQTARRTSEYLHGREICNQRRDRSAWGAPAAPATRRSGSDAVQCRRQRGRASRRATRGQRAHATRPSSRAAGDRWSATRGLLATREPTARCGFRASGAFPACERFRERDGREDPPAHGRIGPGGEDAARGRTSVLGAPALARVRRSSRHPSSRLISPSRQTARSTRLAPADHRPRLGQPATIGCAEYDDWPGVHGAPAPDD